MSKQDRQGVRTPADIERKYDLGQDYNKIANIATNAQKSAERASLAVEALSKSVDERFEDLEVESGGYYTPAVTQPSTDKMQIAYTPSEASMPSVNPFTVTLPKGEKGEKGDTGEQGERGEAGTSGVYIGSDEPTDETITVWIDPNGEGQVPVGMTVAEIRAICT